MSLPALSPGFGGQSAPPSLKELMPEIPIDGPVVFRGAVRPPFIEGPVYLVLPSVAIMFRGAVRPPFIEGLAMMRQ